MCNMILITVTINVIINCQNNTYFTFIAVLHSWLITISIGSIDF